MGTFAIFRSFCEIRKFCKSCSLLIFLGQGHCFGSGPWVDQDLDQNNVPGQILVRFLAFWSFWFWAKFGQNPDQVLIWFQAKFGRVAGVLSGLGLRPGPRGARVGPSRDYV